MCAKFIGNHITFDDKHNIAVAVSVIVIFRRVEIPQPATKFRNYLIFLFVFVFILHIVICTALLIDR